MKRTALIVFFEINIINVIQQRVVDEATARWGERFLATSLIAGSSRVEIETDLICFSLADLY